MGRPQWRDKLNPRKPITRVLEAVVEGMCRGEAVVLFGRKFEAVNSELLSCA